MSTKGEPVERGTLRKRVRVTHRDWKAFHGNALPPAALKIKNPII